MNKIYSALFVLACCFSLQVSAQSFSDNFDSYAPGAYLAQSNPAWKTWGNTPGGSDDIKISNAKAKSGSNSLYFYSVAGGPSDIVLPFGGEYTTGTMNISMWMFIDNQKKGYFNLQEQAIVSRYWLDDNRGYLILKFIEGLC